MQQLRCTIVLRRHTTFQGVEAVKRAFDSPLTAPYCTILHHTAPYYNVTRHAGVEAVKKLFRAAEDDDAATVATILTTAAAAAAAGAAAADSVAAAQLCMEVDHFGWTPLMVAAAANVSDHY